MVTQHRHETLIAVLGFANDPTDFAFIESYQAGRRIAEHGATLICGNNRATFLAAITGAYTYGGESIEIVTKDLCVSAPMATYRWLCATQQEKHQQILNAADAAIVIGGGHHSLRLANEFVRQNTPIVAIADSGGIVDNELNPSVPRFTDSRGGVDRLMSELSLYPQLAKSA